MGGALASTQSRPIGRLASWEDHLVDIAGLPIEIILNSVALLVSLVALVVAIIAFLHERAHANTHGLLASLTSHLVPRPTRNGTTTGKGLWSVEIEMIGPAPVLQAQPVVFVEAGEDLIEVIAEPKLVPVWGPESDPLTIWIKRTDPTELPSRIWAGVTWAEPVTYGKGLISRVQRWEVYVKNGEPGRVSESWSHRGKGRWVKRRRPFWRPEPTNRWKADLVDREVNKRGDRGPDDGVDRDASTTGEGEQ